MANSNVPDPKRDYPDPADEPRSKATQAAADRFLTGRRPFTEDRKSTNRRGRGR